MPADEEQRPAAEQSSPAVLASGIPNLDRVLGGGLLRGATVMVIGGPGTGKTMLAQQLSFSLAAQGQATLYLTGYSEAHDKLLAHSSGLDFFDPRHMGQAIQLLSLIGLLEQGASETEDAIVTMARQQRVALVVLDGFRSMRRFLPDDLAVAHFLYSLGTKLSMLGTTTLVAVEGNPDEPARYPELTVCDTILTLQRLPHGGRFRRVLDVRKLRGAAPLEGLHPFTLDQRGMRITPRFESVAAADPPAWTDERASFGVPALDTLMGGGLTTGTSTLIAGSPGVGKTLLGLHFAAQGAAVAEPALFLGFMEDAAQLRAQAQTFGIDLAAAEASGLLRLLVLPGYDVEIDQVAELLMDDIARRGVRRLVIDSVAELERGIASPQRTPEFLSALVSYLRGQGVTTCVTSSLPTIVSPTLELTGLALAVLAENLLLLRYAEYYGALHRLLSVLKMRFSSYDASLHEYAIVAGEGFHLLGAMPAGTGLLTGVPHILPDTPAPPRVPEREE